MGWSVRRPAAVAVCSLLLAGCAAADLSTSAPSPSRRVDTSMKARCGSLDIMTPNWRNPDPSVTRVRSVAAARRITHLPLVAPRGLRRPADIYALPIDAQFVYHGPPTGDVIVIEGRPQGSAADWQQELKVVPAQNGKPYVTGTARVIDLGDGAQALQTKSPCMTGSTTDWHTADRRMEIIIEAHTAGEDVGARIARLTEQAAAR